MKFLSLIIAVFISVSVSAQSGDEAAIRKILTEQTESWNEGNIEAFMKGYWNSDSLMFIGSNGITYGFQNTLNNYRKNYDTPDKMGKLRFQLLKVQRLSPEYYFVVGKWDLTRKAGNVGGHYDLIFRKINGTWFIISDHSS
ncbi:YybH family protein [Flavitalea antarctica]